MYFFMFCVISLKKLQKCTRCRKHQSQRTYDDKIISRNEFVLLFLYDWRNSSIYCKRHWANQN